MTDIRVAHDELQQYVRQIMLAYGVDRVQADVVAHILVWSDLIGRPNYGVLRLHIHMQRMQKGLFNTPCTPVFHETTNAMQLLDGDHGFDQSRIQSRDASCFQDKGVVLPTVAPDASLILGTTFDNEPHTRVGGNIGED